MEKRHLDELQLQGYTACKALFDDKTIAQLRDRLLQHSPAKTNAHEFIYNLQNKDIFFYTTIVRQPLLRNILLQCLNDRWYKRIPQDKANFILRGLVGRSSGKEALSLHIDSFIPAAGPYIWNMVVSIALGNSGRDNGCTLVIPGSHRIGEYATQDWLKYAHNIELDPGDVFIFDSRVWHGAGANKSDTTRWVINATFSRWWIKQSFDIAGSIPKGFLAELTEEEIGILGFCSDPPVDENDRIDIKGGYDLLPTRIQTISQKEF